MMSEDKEEINMTFQRSSKKFTIKKHQPNHLNEVLKNNLAQFIGPETKNFFKRFEIKTNFLAKDPSEWISDQNYQDAREIVTKLKVINDVAEKAVKLIEDYNKSLTKNEEQQKYLIQVVCDFRNDPDYKKSTVKRG